MNVADFARFCADYDVALVVGSRDRADILAKYTDRLAQGYRLFYSGDGYDQEYRGCIDKVEVPRGVKGHAAAWNHILRNVDERIVILLDDDIKLVYWLGESWNYRVGPEGFLVMLVNLVVTAVDLGVGLFGVSDVDIRKTSPLTPFHPRAMIGCLTGIVGRGIWYDERNIIKDDYDHVLQHLKHDRLVWKDMRYFLSQDRNILPGGQMPFRTVERELAEVERLKDWWGHDMVHYSKKLGTMSLSFSL